MKEDKPIYNGEEAIVEVGEMIKTALSDETIVLDVDKDNAILFDGRHLFKFLAYNVIMINSFVIKATTSYKYPQEKDSTVIDIINKIVDDDYEGFVKAMNRFI